jgi:outer membrane scaffolding protein for murein synthesis (MipA/OmpV family)
MFPMARRTGATCLLALAAPLVHADQPLWELGLGAGALRVPHYRGSDQSHHWLLPVPYVVYRGDFLRSDREGARAVLLERERVEVDLSLDATPPLASSDSRARAGMADLKATLEIGPKVNLLLGQGAGWKLHLRLPLRGVVTLEGKPSPVGWTLNPELDLDLRWQGWNLGLQGGPLAATRRFHAYYYDVAAADATMARPAYAARGGAAGWGIAASATRRLGDWWLAAFWRADTLAGATFVDSPLVRQRQNTTLGLALSYVFAVSEKRVPDRP